MNKKLLATSTILLFILLTSLAATTQAQTEQVTVGVEPGDTFRYHITYLWTSTNPANTPPTYWVQYNQTDYYQLTVNMVTSTTVQYNTTLRYQNGTEYQNTGIAEVSQGVTGDIYFYAANLSANNLLYPLSEDMPWVINDTTIRAYPDNTFRSTNHIQVNRTDVTNEKYSAMNLYFDKVTGVMVEATLTNVYTATPQQTFTTHVVLAESNVWTIPEFPTTLPLLATAAIGIAVTALYKKRQLNKA